MITTDEIGNAYRNLDKATADLHNMTEDRIDMSQRLEIERLKGLASGEISGRNPDERLASARAVLVNHYTALEDAETFERHAKLEFDLARLEVERVRCLLRLAEVTAKLEAQP